MACRMMHAPLKFPDDRPLVGGRVLLSAVDAFTHAFEPRYERLRSAVSHAGVPTKGY